MEIRTHKELNVYKLSFEAGMEVFKLTKHFPKVESYSLTDQIRRSSRSVSGNIAEAWGNRRYPKAFISRLTNSEAEARETQNWLDYAYKCEYLKKEDYSQLFDKYDHIIGMIVKMIIKSDKWTI